jgi:6-phosphogluconate dehydrogenase
MPKADIGLVGLAAMGRNLALNLERHGYCVAVYNRTWDRTAEFMLGPGSGKNFLSAKTPEELADGLKTPRIILLMVKAGAAVDAMIHLLAPLLEPGDILMDGGNSHFEDTIRREKMLAAKGVRFMGVGICGGADGALNGPCIMPGGPKEAWLAAGRPLTDIAAKADGAPCCAWVGPDGAGHFVKTAHNGIEYADMQLIAESYALMRTLLGMSAEEMQAVYRLWNTGPLESYLIKITCDILGNIDKNTGRPLVEAILDEAGQKGAGRWAAQQALETGAPAPTIAEAAFARNISAQKKERVIASRLIKQKARKTRINNRYAFIDDVAQALYASKICAWAQGFALMRSMSAERSWGLKPGEIASLWRGGCVIRGRILDLVKGAFDENPLLPNLLAAPAFRQALEEAQLSWRRVVSAAAMAGVPAPCMSSALSYFDAYRSSELPANLIQAQRDYFGAHGYKRNDMPGEFHTEWEKE